MFRMTVEEYKALTGKSASGSKGAKNPKYRNVKVYVYEDGAVLAQKSKEHGCLKECFDSIKEYKRCQELRLLERAHKISNLQQQVPFEIQPAFVGSDGKKHQAIVYRADFTYVEDGREVVEDVKGYSVTKKKYLYTEAFRIKWKLLQNKYPGKEFRIY